MGRAVICDCLPWLALLLVSCAGLWLIVRLNEGRIDFRRLLVLHGNEVGSAQSLSFVLTLPFFVVVILFIVQVSQLMIGTMVVHYAAFAAARAAIVWIPARVGTIPENCVGGLGYLPDVSAPDQTLPDPLHPTPGGRTYLVWPYPGDSLTKGPKYDKIRSAAWLACLPICPSRNLGMSLQSGGAFAHSILSDAYQALAEKSPNNARLEHKLAYAMQYTDVEVRFYHGSSGNLEPSVEYTWEMPYAPPQAAGAEEFVFGQEVGWQDPITVTVTHYLALLPGPGRILANKVGFIRTAADSVQQQVEEDTAAAQPPGNVFVYKLTASCTLGNEGKKSVMPYAYQVY